ncbi:SDR family oxidoreductase [Variovorax dokdonensis]|uniref:SDR family oxidoreductase n=1 Tax=Variovorax dokdonensis TaxID=344883 RepID=A0ABT7NF16_9BURK|nr:SDR family oxidoreductase [Variovorax dokdonensis]MDM0046533.1 SDR family oxidoreductase [Variovorax dokdonensis]
MNTKEHASPVAIVTAAGRGMGAAIARELHARGYRLGLMSPSGSARKLAEELGGFGLDGSVSNLADLQALVQGTHDAFGRVDAVVNHTGHPPKGDLLDLADEAWLAGDQMMVLPVLRMARLVTPMMLAQGKGAFVNISTFAAFEPSLRFPISCTYRAAVGAFTKLYADRYAPSNIRMNALLPGFVDSLAHKDETLQMVPMGRAGSVSEIAKTAAFLLSDDAGYITGQNLRVDGGVTRGV